MHVYEVLMRTCFKKLGLADINHTSFDMKAMINVDYGLSVAPAYLTAIHTLAGGLMLNCCTKYRAMLPDDETVWKRIRSILGQGGHGDGQVSSLFSYKNTARPYKVVVQK
jgi:hypothetical protein